MLSSTSIFGVGISFLLRPFLIIAYFYTFIFACMFLPRGRGGGGGVQNFDLYTIIYKLQIFRLSELCMSAKKVLLNMDVQTIWSFIN